MMPAVPAARPLPRAPRATAGAGDGASTETPYERYLRTMPEGLGGDLIDGEAVIDMSITILHERVFRFFVQLLGIYVEERGLGEVFGSRTVMKVDDDNGFEPDVLFVRAERLHILGERDVREAADVAVEIVSPSSGRRDRVTKFEGYERAGVWEYWLVDPARAEAAFYRLGDDGRYRAVPLVGGRFVSDAVPGFSLDPAVLFGETLPGVLGLVQALLADDDA